MGYPVKYAVLELKVDGGVEYNYEDVTKGFVVSKCYLLEDRLCYYANGDFNHKYVVSYPYDDFEQFVSWYKTNKNNYNFDHYKHYYENRKSPSDEMKKDGFPRYILYELFDDYFWAKEIADTKNGYFRGARLLNASSVVYEKLLKEFDELDLLRGEYEKFIFWNTKDMEVSLEEKIVDSKDSERIIELLDEFEYDEGKKQEIIKKYNDLIKKHKKLVRKKEEGNLS